METILIAGGTGLVGTRLTEILIEQGYKVILLSRSEKASSNHPSLSYAYWNPAKGVVDTKAIAAADHIINLAGAGVADKRWSPERKKEIRDSRVFAGETIVKALRETPHKVQTVVNASAQGWYGPDPAAHADGFREEDKPFADYLATTCVDWERSVEGIEALGIRLAKIRIGIVLANGGGALKEFRKPLAFRVATVLGSGKQLVSWIHVDDLCHIFLHTIRHKNLSGPYNAAAPHPVSNKELIETLARVKFGNNFISVPVPAFVLKIMMGEMSIEVLKSCTISADKIQKAGFSFQFPTIERALANLEKNNS